MEGCVDGASAFVDLTVLYNEVLPPDSKLTASQWIHTWFKWWEKALACHDIPSTHLRKALPTKASGSTDTDTRIFRHPSARLHSTLLLLVGFSGRSRGGKAKDEQIRGTCSGCSSFCTLQLAEEIHQRQSIERDAVWRAYGRDARKIWRTCERACQKQPELVQPEWVQAVGSAGCRLWRAICSIECERLLALCVSTSLDHFGGGKFGRIVPSLLDEGQPRLRQPR
eukprot:1047464-Amphidinium_carterae.1